MAGLPGGTPGSGIFGARGESSFGYVPSGPHVSALSPSEGRSLTGDRGFRIHDVSRHEAERSGSRGLRFAFAAAGAVSLAAIALGGVSTGVPADTSVDGRGASGSGSNVTPVRTQGGGAATAPESQRRRAVGPLLAQGQRSQGDTPVAPTEVSAPLLPGVPAPASQNQVGEMMHSLTAPVVAGAAAMSPLIRPLTEAEPLTLTSWSTVPDVTTPGLLAAPAPTSSPTSSSHSAR